jgi:thiosulfate/3-mercaptopyruvate sulfurtransferase
VVAAFGPLVDAAWLRAHLGEPGLAVVDCRYVLGKPGEGGRAWLEGHIPGAAFLDVDRDLAAEPGERGRHPLPAAADFEAAAARAGIGRASRVVAYDEAGEGGAARLWWLLRHFGHDDAAVLNGGLAAWRDEGGPLEKGGEEAGALDQGAEGAGPRQAAAEHPFVARPREGDTVSATELSATEPGATEPSATKSGATEPSATEPSATESGATKKRLLDARAPERFRGEVEPIDAVAGHIPGAVNVPFAELAPGGRFPPAAELRERLGGEPFVAYCGSGITACTLVLAGELAGVEGRLYPGSWSEWSRRGLPVETSG